jgi:hypothetical protein
MYACFPSGEMAIPLPESASIFFIMPHGGKEIKKER